MALASIPSSFDLSLLDIKPLADEVATSVRVVSASGTPVLELNFNTLPFRSTLSGNAAEVVSVAGLSNARPNCSCTCCNPNVSLSYAFSSVSLGKLEAANKSTP